MDEDLWFVVSRGSHKPCGYSDGNHGLPRRVGQLEESQTLARIISRGSIETTSPGPQQLLRIPCNALFRELPSADKESSMALHHIKEVTSPREAMEAIEKIAFLKWNDAGCPPGEALCYWLTAEREWKAVHKAPPGPTDSDS